MARITTSKGEAQLRPMLNRHEDILSDLMDLEDGKASDWFRLRGRMRKALDESTISTEWDGGFGELPADELLEVYFKWNAATDEEAVPNVTAPSSETPSESGR